MVQIVTLFYTTIESLLETDLKFYTNEILLKQKTISKFIFQNEMYKIFRSITLQSLII